MHLPRMKPLRSRNPVPIGAIFLVVLVGLLVLGFNIDRLPFASGTQYTAAFSDAAGLGAGDTVDVAGIDVGSVRGVKLQGSHVEVTFVITSGGVHLGMDTTATIEIFTLLGNKYLALTPSGPGTWPASREIPQSQTVVPYDVEPAFQNLTRTVSAINTRQLAEAFTTLSDAFQNAPADLRSTLTGLSRVSETIASRDQALSELLQHAAGLTQVLAVRREQIVKILSDGALLLQTLEARQSVISQLLTNTAALSTQLTGLVKDNQATIGPALRHVNDVATILDNNENDLDIILQELYVFVRGEVDATGAGPWFDGAAINVTNPITVSGKIPTDVGSRLAKTLGGLLGVPGAGS